MPILMMRRNFNSSRTTTGEARKKPALKIDEDKKAGFEEFSQQQFSFPPRTGLHLQESFARLFISFHGQFNGITDSHQQQPRMNCPWSNRFQLKNHSQHHLQVATSSYLEGGSEVEEERRRRHEKTLTIIELSLAHLIASSSKATHHHDPCMLRHGGCSPEQRTCLVSKEVPSSSLNTNSNNNSDTHWMAIHSSSE